MIAVVPNDCPEDLLASLCREIEGRGWRAEVSRGAEQTLLAIAGAPSLEAARELVGRRTEADLFELLSAREYRLERRLRALLQGLTGALLVLVALGGALAALGFLQPPPRAHFPGEWIDAGRLADLAPDRPRLVRDGETPILVGRGPGSRLFALRATCTHLDDCLLEWNDERKEVACPCHGCLFDTYGNVIRGPAAIPLRSYEVDTIGGEVVLRR